MSDWRTIETAPRDGTIIEVMDPDCGQFLMRWNTATAFGNVPETISLGARTKALVRVIGGPRETPRASRERAGHQRLHF